MADGKDMAEDLRRMAERLPKDQIIVTTVRPPRYIPVPIGPESPGIEAPYMPKYIRLIKGRDRTDG